MSWNWRKYGTGADRCGGFYIPLAPPLALPTTHEQSDFAHCKFLVFCSLQPTKSACSAAAEKCLSSVGQPLSSVSGRKRYNTLDFASKIVCQQGCFSPLLETQSQGMCLACRLGQCFKMLCILRSPPETRTPLDTRIFSSKMVPKL